MKKIILSILCFAIIVILTGCKNNIKEEPSTNNTLKISLDSNPSTGYNWKYEVDNDDIITIKQSYDNSECPEDVDGCGGQEIFLINGVKQGKATMNLKYCFLDTDECYRAVAYEITVDEDLSISEKHYELYFE